MSTTDNDTTEPTSRCTTEVETVPAGRGLARRRRRGQRGMTTAEYAVGTIATVSFAGILIKILTDPTLQKLLLDLVTFLIKLFWPGA